MALCPGGALSHTERSSWKRQGQQHTDILRRAPFVPGKAIGAGWPYTPIMSAPTLILAVCSGGAADRALFAADRLWPPVLFSLIRSVQLLRTKSLLGTETRS